MAIYPHFAPYEFEKCVPACSIKDMQESFLNRLETARILAGIPFHLNSAYRSPEWDKSKGRSGNSYHCKGRAVDIRTTGSFDRGIIVRACIEAGFKGIGISNTFVHIDDRGFNSPLIWLY